FATSPDRVHGQAESYGNTDRSTHVIQVGSSHKTGAHVECAERCPENRIRPIPPKPIAYRTHIGSTLHAIRNHLLRCDRAQLGIVRIVIIQGTNARGSTTHSGKQLLLGQEVRAHVAMKIQMVSTEVCEDSNLETQCSNAL